MPFLSELRDDELEAIGYAWALGTACIVDGVYVSKYSVGNTDKATPWIAMGAVGAMGAVKHVATATAVAKPVMATAVAKPVVTATAVAAA